MNIINYTSSIMHTFIYIFFIRVLFISLNLLKKCMIGITFRNQIIWSIIIKINNELKIHLRWSKLLILLLRHILKLIKQINLKHNQDLIKNIQQSCHIYHPALCTTKTSTLKKKPIKLRDSQRSNSQRNRNPTLASKPLLLI